MNEPEKILTDKNPSVNNRSPRFINLTGRSFGRLEVVKLYEVKKGVTFWLCRCACKNELAVRQSSLKSGNTKSCGCLNDELRAARNFVHGDNFRGARTPEYDAWCKLRQRCRDEKDKDYPNYGGRGILCCQRWLDSFGNFLEDVGRKPSPKHLIDRIDVNGNYCPENCRWSTQIESANNTRSNRFLEFGGERKTVAQWAKKLHINRETLSSRIDDSGWSIERALTTPVIKQNER